jgi:hypothetical protein
MDFLKRVLNAQLSVTLLVWLSATILLAFKLVPPEVWKDVVHACLLFFVGGGLLRDGFTAYASRTSFNETAKTDGTTTK